MVGNCTSLELLHTNENAKNIFSHSLQREIYDVMKCIENVYHDFSWVNAEAAGMKSRAYNNVHSRMVKGISLLYIYYVIFLYFKENLMMKESYIFNKIKRHDISV